MLVADDRYPKGSRRGRREGFCAYSLEDWLESAAAADVPMVPAKHLADFEKTDLLNHERTGPHQKRLDDGYALCEARRSLRTMVRWDCCAPAWLKADQYAAICKALIRRIGTAELRLVETTGADTAHARNEAGIEKTHANDAACCGSTGSVTELRNPVALKSVGHGRCKQIKSLPTGPYLRWRHQKPAIRNATPCPGHARHPNRVHGIRTGDLARILTKKGWRKGDAQVASASGRVHVRTSRGKHSTAKSTHIVKIAPRNGYRESN